MCRKCGKPISIQIHRSSTCPFCGADLHSCVNCSFYSPGSHYDCHETVEELVKDKDKANFCGFFSVAKNFNSASSEDKAQKARDAFNALFSS
ncbi:MAG: hypothetical protein IJP61_04465 [Treponema sp.]|nr:hypothetical protein [Treponema sp.]